jgi:hypothetical protein
MGAEELKNTEIMSKLKLKSDDDTAHFLLAMRLSTAKQALAIEVESVENSVKADTDGFNKQIAALDKFAKDYEVKYRELKNKIIQTETAGDNQIEVLQQKALLKQEQDIRTAYTKMADDISNNIAKSIIENKSLAQSMEKTGEAMLEGMIQNLVKMVLLHDKAKLSDAEKAAADAFAWAGNPILGAVLAAGAFAAVMSFEGGGEVPGSGAVPIMAHAGETVVTKALTEQVKQSEGKSGGDNHFHYAPQVHAIDGDGVEKMLNQHAGKFAKAMQSHLRRMNH